MSQRLSGNVSERKQVPPAALISAEPEEQSRNYGYRPSAVLLSTMDDRRQLDSWRWRFAGELHGMRDSDESHGIWRWVRARKKEEGGSRIRGNLREEGSEDGGRGEW